MIPTKSITDLIYGIDELVASENEELKECEHKTVVRYGADYYCCSECGAKIEESDIKQKYKQVR